MGGAVADAADPIGEEIARAEERVAPNRERLRRIGDAAKALSIGSREFIWAAGGPEPADFIARRFAAGLPVDRLRTALAEAQKGSGKGELGQPYGGKPDAPRVASVVTKAGNVQLIGMPAKTDKALLVAQEAFEDRPVPRRMAH